MEVTIYQRGISMDYQKKEKIFSFAVILTFLLAIAAHYLWAPWGFYAKVSPEEASLRTALVDAACSWEGAKESDGTHRPIVDRYNTVLPLPVGYVLDYSDSWCAAFVTVAAMDAGFTDIIPPECSCERQIQLFQSMDCWVEEDNIIPHPGDLIYYDWNVSRQGNSTGWADHVGIVAGVKWPFIKVIEGNKDDAVAFRIIPIGHKTIRGFALPNYAQVTEFSP